MSKPMDKLWDTLYAAEYDYRYVEATSQTFSANALSSASKATTRARLTRSVLRSAPSAEARGWTATVRCLRPTPTRKADMAQKSELSRPRDPRPMPRLPPTSTPTRSAGKDEFLIVTREPEGSGFEFLHEPCGEILLITLRVHLDTLRRLANGHVCPKAG